MSGPVRRRVDAERNRNHILDAAARVLRANPGASFEDIIAGTDVARTTVYRHFPTRDQLVDQLIARALAQVHDVLEQARPSEPPFTQALERMTRSALAAGGDVWGLLTAVTEERLATSPPVADITAAVTTMIELGVAEGVLRSDIPVPWLTETYFTTLACAVRDQQTSEPATHLVNSLFNQGASQKQQIISATAHDGKGSAGP